MFIDGRTIESGQRLETEVCIIGAGAAGITLAREFSNLPFRVVLVESGGLKHDQVNQGLYKGANTGHPYYKLDEVRARYFGGSTNLWGGHCLPIRPMNFEVRPWIPLSGWPITRKQLDPYYRRAHQIIGIGEYNYNPATLSLQIGKKIFPFDHSRIITVASRYNPLRFGPAYEADIRKAKNITTYLHSNVVSINQGRDSDSITDVEIKTLNGSHYYIQAKYFLLATGGIENARTLLLSDSVQSSGLGNQHDLVGRHFMEHIWYPNGYIIPVDQNVTFDFYIKQHRIANNVTTMAHLSLPEAVIRRERIPDFRAEIGLEQAPLWQYDTSSAHRIRANSGQGKKRSRELDQRVLSILEEMEPGPNMNAHKQGLIRYRLANYSEQVPNPDSRVTLGEKTDALGLRRAQLHWQLTELDKRGIRRAQELIAQEVGKAGFGRVRMELIEDEDILLKDARGGHHHMGTTRMGDDPKTSVVNKDCRIHGLDNLYVAGTSVFPSGGFANPTLTLVALAVRLADHIQSRLHS